MRGGLSNRGLQSSLARGGGGGEGGDLLTEQVDALRQLADAPAHRVYIRQVVCGLAIE